LIVRVRGLLGVVATFAKLIQMGSNPIESTILEEESLIRELAQPVRAFDLGSKGQRLKSFISDHIKEGVTYLGSYLLIYGKVVSGMTPLGAKVFMPEWCRWSARLSEEQEVSDHSGVLAPFLLG
jgi:hypothetical protein